MVKILRYADPEYTWYAMAIHWGGFARDDPHAWHSIHEHTIDNMPPVGAFLWPLQQPTQHDARICALTLAQMPLILRDICPYCWDDDWWWLQTPRYPRWNIYRAPNRQRTIPAIHWDCNNPVPPPGYDYILPP